MATTLCETFYQLTLHCNIEYTTGQMVLHLKRYTPGYTAIDVLDAWVFSIQAAFLAAIPQNTTLYSIRAFNFIDPMDFDDRVINYAGSRPGQRMPPHDCAVLRFTTTRRDMPHGYKRLPGLSESDQAQGLLTGSYTPVAQALVDAMLDYWRRPDTQIVCQFAIVSRVKYLSPNGKEAWRLPENDDELKYYIPVAGIVQTPVRTQVSRKI